MLNGVNLVRGLNDVADTLGMSSLYVLLLNGNEGFLELRIATDCLVYRHLIVLVG